MYPLLTTILNDDSLFSISHGEMHILTETICIYHQGNSHPLSIARGAYPHITLHAQVPIIIIACGDGKKMDTVVRADLQSTQHKTLPQRESIPCCTKLIINVLADHWKKNIKGSIVYV
jgi:hypothetical protein